MYDNLLSDLPRQTSYVELIPHLPHLQSALFDIYTEYMRIGLRTVKTFGRGNNCKCSLPFFALADTSLL